jgi:HlyD family secretion protein
MAKRSRKKLWLIGGIAVVIIVGAVIVTNSGSGDEATGVQADLAYVDDIAEKVKASGRIQPQTKVDIVAEVSAEIVAIHGEEGDVVRRGQDLIQLDTVQINSDVNQARFSLDEIVARMASAKAEYVKDEKEFNRQTQLFNQGMTSETALTDAEFAFQSSKANYEATSAQVKTARARLEKAEDQLSKTRITAPMDGVITYLSVEVGEIAQAQTSFTQGRTLMTVSDLSVFEVEVEVDESEIAKVSEGQVAEIRVDAYRDTTFPGEVVEIGNSAIIDGEGSENYSTSFRVKVRFADVGEAVLRPGMSATVEITTATDRDAVLIPYAAVVTREFDPDSLKSEEPSGGVQAAENDETLARNVAATSIDDDTHGRKEKLKKTGVFVVRGGVATFVEVETGIADELNIVALSGVTAGDTVVSGSFQTLRRLEDGEAVQIDEASQDRIEENSN